MKKKRLLLTTVFMLALFPAVWAAAGPEPQASSPQAVFMESSWKFNPVLEGEEVIHDFAVKNQGNAPLEILKVKTS